MQWIKVESSQIAEVGFTEPDTLGIRFLKKDETVSEYTYANVTFAMYRAMTKAKSVGIWFKENIKDKKDEAGDLLYPYTKVESENPLQPTLRHTDGTKAGTGPASTPVLTVDAETPVSTQSNGAESTTDSKTTALAKVDDLKPEWVFVPGNMDTLLQEIREQALAEVKGLNISTPKMRKQFKDTKNKVVKSRTYIEKMRVSYVSAEKKRLATVDTESRRIQDILRGIEDEVAAPLTAWETKEEERIQGHNDAIAAIREDPSYGLQETVAELEKRIEWLGQYLGSRDWQEFQVVAEKTIEEEVDRTQLLLEKATVRERERLELEALRAEQAASKERERLAEVQRAEDARVAAAAEKLAADRIQASVEAARVGTRQEVVAELAAPKPEMKAPEGSLARIVDDAEDAASDTFKDYIVSLNEPVTRAELDSVDTAHIVSVQTLAIEALVTHSEATRDVAVSVIEAIHAGRIPCVNIHY